MLKIPQADGTFLKIRKKRKSRATGRKRGRPRKKVETPKIPLSKKRPYSIILTSNGKQKKSLRSFRTEEEAYMYLSNTISENKVMFPVKFLNSKGIIEAKYELYIIKRIDNDDIKDTAYLRNDYGELVEYTTNSENWQIIHKEKWEVEETFWVNGYDPVFQRKDFNWIIDNLIMNDIGFYTFKNVLVYKNKLIIDTNGDLEIIFCKNVSDAFRLYTEIENLSIKKKMKYIMFSGDISTFSRGTIISWIDKLCEATGFNRRKITRKSLRP